MTELVKVEEIELAQGLAQVLTLQRPEERNPLDHATISCLLGLAREADEEPAIRVLIITGTGTAFSAGGDLRAYLDLYRDERAFRAFLADFRMLNALLETGRFVSIAMVNGACVAGGLELALACDVVTIADDAKIGDGHIQIGQIDGAGGSQRLVRALGTQRAKQLLLTGSLWTGTQAAAEGLALFSAQVTTLRSQTLDLAEQLGAHSPLAVHHMKALVGYAAHMELEAGLSAEMELVVDYATRSHDATEGLFAFLERRSPKWTGD
jgi:enoyl-CoA hydratase